MAVPKLGPRFFSSAGRQLIAFSKRPFVRSVVVLASGTAVAQAVSMAFLPLLARLYGPEAYGGMGVFMAIAGVASAVAAMTYPVAVVLPSRDADAVGLIRLSLVVAIGTSGIVTCVLALRGSRVAALVNAPEFASFMYLIPAYMIISVLNATAKQWLVRKAAFALIARVSVWQAIMTGVIKSGFGAISPTAAVLAGTNTFAGVLGVALMVRGWRTMSNRTEPIVKGAEQRLTVPALALRYRDFPLLRTPQYLLSTLSDSLPAVLLATLFGVSSVGHYSMAFAVLGVPVRLIGGSVMQVFYPRITEAIRRGEDVRALIVKATVGLALSGAIPFVLVLVAGPVLFTLVLGDRWHSAGVYAQWLSIWLFLQHCSKAAVAAVPALQRQKDMLVFELMTSSAKVLALYVGYELFASDLASIALYSIVGGAASASLVMWIVVCSGSNATSQSMAKP